VACDLKFSKRETILIHIKLHEDEFDVEQVTLTDTTCPECNSVSMKFFDFFSYISIICIYYIVYMKTSRFGSIVRTENFDLVSSRLQPTF